MAVDQTCGTGRGSPTTHWEKSPIKAAFKELRNVAPDIVCGYALNDAQSTISDELETAAQDIGAKAAAQLGKMARPTMPGQIARRGAATHSPRWKTSAWMSCVTGFEPVDGRNRCSLLLSMRSIFQSTILHAICKTYLGIWRPAAAFTQQPCKPGCRSASPCPFESLRLVGCTGMAVDVTHLAMFHQFEGLWIDKGLTFAHGLLTFIAKSLYGDGRIQTQVLPIHGTIGRCGFGLCDLWRRMRPATVGWVTILARMVHPKVFHSMIRGSHVFGLGTTRMAAQWAGVSKVKSLYDQELAVLHVASSTPWRCSMKINKHSPTIHRPP